MSMPVNVHTEWGPLKEVVVGSVFNATPHNVDLSFKVFFSDNIRDVLLKNSVALQSRLIDERQQDLDNLAQTLAGLGIKVHRPQRLEQVREFHTPNFSDHLSPCDNPRDQVLILGNRIIETPCIWRKRYFENDQLKKILYPFFHAGSPWISAPRPTMRDESFDLSYMKGNVNLEPGRIERQRPEDFEIMFDAAQCLKFGRDVLMNVSNDNHLLGLKWMESLWGNEYRFHPVRLCDHHIDGMLMPVGPGKILINAGTMPQLLDRLPERFRRWEIIRSEVSCMEQYATNLASTNIYANVFPVGPNRIIVFNETNTPDADFARVLDRHGIESLHVRLRHSRLFGGGAHCATLDLVRDEVLEDYFS